MHLNKLKDLNATLKSFSSEIKYMKDALDAYESALEFYAKDINYKPGVDMTATARNVLEVYKEKENDRTNNL